MTSLSPVSEERFDGRVVIVTGAGSGLGASHAQLFSERGAKVVVNDLVNESAEITTASIDLAGGIAVPCAADASTPEGAATLVRCALERFGGLDVVVNNAGLLRTADVAQLGVDVFDQVLAANLRSTFLVTQAAWPHFAGQKYGRIVSTTSNSGLLGTAGSVAYAAAKAGVWGITRTLALEGSSLGIHVNAIAPMAYTPMAATSRIAPRSWQEGKPDAWGQRLDTTFVSPVVAWLAHEHCKQTGQVWSAAGGRVARFFMGLTDGWIEDELTIELVRDREAELFGHESFAELDRSSDEGRQLHRRIMGR